MIRKCISQYAPQIAKHDAVGNEVFAIRKILSELGVPSQTLCERAEPDLHSSVCAWSGQRAQKSDLTLVHYSHGDPAYERVFSSPEPKLLVYHNITPGKFFQGTHPNLARASDSGREFLATLGRRVDFAVAHSSYSAAELTGFGFHGIEVLPYLTLDSLYGLRPDEDIMRRFGEDGMVNLISVGQVAPHKCIEDCILTFDYFKRHVNRRSRLIIVGGWDGTQAYLLRLKRLIQALDVQDVLFTGRVTQAALLAYYHTADAFLCMSEHEGFCVPLVEAMRFDLPVFAYASTAVPETLGHAGVLFKDKHWPTIAEAIGIVAEEDAWRDKILADQRSRLSFYSAEASRERFRSLLHRLGILSPA